MHVQERIPLAPYTTFGIGGTARFFIDAQTPEDIQEAILFARTKQLPSLILGGGSNMLISDEGFSGVVIHMGLRGVLFEEKEGGEVWVTAAAGESWDSLVAETTARGLWGMENLSGIPGSVGAAPVQNIGAYGAELKDTCARVLVLDTETQTQRIFERAECLFGYRTSIFKEQLDRYVILSVTFLLQKNASPNMSYAQLASLCGDTTSSTSSHIRNKVLNIRKNKFPDITVEGTAGSFFMNPVVSPEKAEELLIRYPTLPTYTIEGGVKISLAWLLDNALHLKGFSLGKARLFEAQPLVVVALRGASSREVIELSRVVKEKIKNTFALDVEQEVRNIF